MPVGEAWLGPWLCKIACELELTDVPLLVPVGRVVAVVGDVVVVVVVTDPSFIGRLIGP